METAWIQVFVLTLSECVAPAGKTICQERDVEMQFIDRATCELAMEKMIWMADGAADIIINRERTRCAASAVERPVFSSLEDVQAQAGDPQNWQAPGGGDLPPPDFTQQAHQERLASLPTCEESRGVPPCKVGEIIIEREAEEKPAIWRRSQ